MSKYFEKSERNVLLLIIGLILLFYFILPYLQVGFFASPSTDDQCYASGLRHPLKSWKGEGGRMTAYILLSIKQLYSIEIYRFLPLVFLLWFWHAIYYSLSKLLLRGCQKLTIIIASLIAFTAIIVNIPSTAESFYWLTGFTVYTMPVILTIYLMTNIGSIFVNEDSFEKEPIWSKSIQYGMNFLLIMIIVFNHELAMVFLNAYLGLLLLAHIINVKLEKSRKFNITYALYLFASMVFSLIVLKAPGNSNREIRMDSSVAVPENQELLNAIMSAGTKTIEILVYYVTSNVVVLGLITMFILIISSDQGFGKRVESSTNIKPNLLAKWLPFGILFIIPILAIPSYIYLGTFSRLRFYNLIYIFTLVSIFYLIIVNLNHVNRAGNRLRLMRWGSGVLGGVMIFIWFEKGNTPMVYQDLYSGKASGFYQEFAERDSILSSTAAVNVRIPWIKTHPTSIFKSDNLTGAAATKCLCSYYEKKKITPLGRRPKRRAQRPFE